MNDLEISKGEYHAITFESSYLQKQFRQSMLKYFYNKTQEDCTYLKILNEKGDLINSKDFYFIPFDCNVINLTDHKDTSNLLRELLFHHIEHNPDLLQGYVVLNDQINKFFSGIEFKRENLLIEFHPTEKSIKQLIKSLDISIEYNEREYVPNYILRNYLIRSLLDMNQLEKEVFLLISFPETDVGREDFAEVIHLLKMFNVTTLVITSQRDFLTAANEDCIFLVEKSGIFYDIIELRRELLAFQLVDPEESLEVAKSLSFHDYIKDYYLLDKEMKKFLLSSRL